MSFIQRVLLIDVPLQYASATINNKLASRAIAILAGVGIILKKQVYCYYSSDSPQVKYTSLEWSHSEGEESTV